MTTRRGQNYNVKESDMENIKATPEAPQTPVPATPPTTESLIAQLKLAVEAGDYKAAGNLSKQLIGAQQAAEALAEATKQNALRAVTAKVIVAIQNALKPLAKEMAEAKADGVWFVQDDVSTELSCRLFKSKPKTPSTPRASGGGAGKRYAISTTELLSKHGAEPMPEHKRGGANGVTIVAGAETFQQAQDASTDKNDRFSVRKLLLTQAGVTE